MFNIQKMTIKRIIATLAVTLPATSISSHSNAEQLIEEIIVTASKRENTLQESSVAVSVVTSDAIEKAQILDLRDLQSIVPSLRVNQLQNSSNTNFNIRGFGNGANNPGIEPSVGVFIDGVYRSRSAAQISDLPNLERVEVLRGPQSTLFGKNASAGVVSVVTAVPDGEQYSKISLTAGNYNQLLLKAVTAGALSDSVAFELSATKNTRDGYVDNVTLGSEVGERNRKSVRGQLMITPNDKTRIRIIADIDKIDEICCPVNNLFESPLETFVNAQTGAVIVPNTRFSSRAHYNQNPANKIDNSGFSVQVDHDFEHFTLTSITADRRVESFSNIDADFTSANYITNPIDTDIDTFTQELRLTSNGSGNLDWMVGAYYFDESIDHSDRLDYGPSFRPFIDALTLAQGSPNALAGVETILGLPVGQAFFPASGGVHEVSTLDNEALSFFGQLDWHINDRLTATLGLNYTEDEKDATLEQIEQDSFSSIDFVQLGFGAIFQQLVGMGLDPALATAQATALSTTEANPFLPLQAVQFLPPVLAYPNSVEDGKTDDDEITYTFRLSYQLNDNINIYGGVGTGFKASSINMSRDSLPFAANMAALQAAGLTLPNLGTGTRNADPEEATLIELGLKAKFERGTLNIAIFDQEIDNFQSNIFEGTGFKLINAEKQSTEGIEFDLTYWPTDALRLSIAGTFLDPVFDSFTQSTVGDISGKTPAGIHETSLSLAASYNFTIGGNEAYINGDYQYEDDVPTNDNIPASISSEEIKSLNLRAGLTIQNGLSLSIWARNLTNHRSISTAFRTVGGTGGVFGYPTQPRTYGMSIGMEF
jgi:outer membrane receptor protein involved in Fe transport